MSKKLSEEIREYVETLGMITEGEYIPNRPRTLQVNMDHWDAFPRMMIRWHNPFGPTPAVFDKGILNFYDEQSYEDAKKKLQTLGISFDELDDEMTTHKDKELRHDTAGQLSPYPSNRDIFDHEF
jgi:hypothetical protein